METTKIQFENENKVSRNPTNEKSENPKFDMVVDWVQVTIKNRTYVDIIHEVFGLSCNDCTHMNSAKFGYNESFVINHEIYIMFNRKRPEMGVHIQMSGSACRDYENCFGDWLTFFHMISNYNYHFTRLDIAIDMYEPIFTVNKLKNKVKKGELVSRFKQMTYHTKYDIKDGAQHSATVHFGSMTSDIYIVIYDKLAERSDAGYKVDKNITFWTRLEIRFKKDLSDTVVYNYMKSPETFGTFIKSVIYNYIDFKDKGETERKTRWKTSDFWLDILDHVEKRSIAGKAIQSSIQRKMKYAETYQSKLIAMCYCCDNDFTKSLVKKGLANINEFDLDIINEYLTQNNQRIITRYELEQAKNKLIYYDKLELL